MQHTPPPRVPRGIASRNFALQILDKEKGFEFPSKRGRKGRLSTPTALHLVPISGLGKGSKGTSLRPHLRPSPPSLQERMSGGAGGGQRAETLWEPSGFTGLPPSPPRLNRTFPMPLGAMESGTFLPILVAATPHHPGRLAASQGPPAILCRRWVSPPLCLAQPRVILTPTRRCQDPSPYGLSQPPAVPLISQDCAAGAQQAARPHPHPGRGARRPLPHRGPSAATVALCAHTRRPAALPPGAWPGLSGLRQRSLVPATCPPLGGGGAQFRDWGVGRRDRPAFPGGPSAGEQDGDRQRLSPTNRNRAMLLGFPFLLGGSPFSALLWKTSAPHFMKSQG